MDGDGRHPHSATASSLGRAFDYLKTRADIDGEQIGLLGEAALKAGGNPDYTLRIIPRANHVQLESEQEETLNVEL